ncbi:uncharacterized protein EI97DRAFT_248374 [Westerdykella ornata]|uniref:HCP-like protein n=1 Tax=Westerdykella ornata TaxID=318751 RepID=A0A6A6JP95_WESOR|nr:uncharacterized protein EI97DRAFT_248374 [Westerdykella ornata]KAF2278217.1 hypothetical protein EI97DRAFT_248374 [Westerdykella ornata]
MASRQARPSGLEPRSPSSESDISQLAIHDLPSPRVGEIPPALSPLDALALQGRLLARRFEQESKAGRRMSRLAPLTIQNEFGNRPGYFSSLTNSSVNSPNEARPPISPGRPPVTPRSPREVNLTDKHKSFYPQIGDPQNDPPLSFKNNLSTIGESNPSQHPPHSYFDMPPSRSPEPAIGVQEATPVSPNHPTSHSQPLARQKQPSMDSLSARAHPQAGLRPPRSPGSVRDVSRDRSPRPSPSMRSVPGDSDEFEAMSMGGSYDSLQARGMSSSSSISRAHSPYTPFSNPTIPRSPSLSSEFSAGGSQLPRPAFNFSRPMSSAGRPSLDVRASDLPLRQASDESAVTRPSYDSLVQRQEAIESPMPNYGGEVVHTPVSMTSEDFRRSGDFSNNPTSTYTYSKFSLPRGRPLDRQSIGIEDFLNSQITWDKPATNDDQQRPPSPESPPRSSGPISTHVPATPRRDASVDRSAPSLTSSNSTIRARPEGAAEITAQEHCDKGIALHEAGDFMKSTYHLRLAARAGLPEAMFWYGLACRHGWGMRENKAEALQWLRKAVDSGQLEVADDEDQSKHGQPIDLVKRKQHRAQYAVAIYELGKCYGNGWGAPQDKALALRCYEIAGNWGDADALVEAAYCYAEGVGCKKDMKKAARLYRAAGAKGVSMVGNSWIYKEKYMDDSSTTSDARSVRSGRSVKRDNSEKKPRDKSRTRTIFGRKKSTA